MLKKSIFSNQGLVMVQMTDNNFFVITISAFLSATVRNHIVNNNQEVLDFEDEYVVFVPRLLEVIT